MPLEIVRGDITKVKADAIVNTTNPAGIPGGQGVDAAIRAAAGPALEEAMAALGGIPVGTAAVTEAFGLTNCRHIIHTAAPIWMDGQQGEPLLLAHSYHAVFRQAAELGCGTLAIPVLSAGANGCPALLAYRTAVREARAFLDETDADLTILLVLYDRRLTAGNAPLERDMQRYVDGIYLNRPALSGYGAAPPPMASAPSMAAPPEPDLFQSEKAEAKPRGKNRRLNIFRRRQRDDSIDTLQATPRGEREEPEEIEESDMLSARRESLWDTGALPSAVNGAFPLDIRAEDLDKSFGEMVSWWIQEKGLRTTEFYTRANLTKATFSSIKNHPEKIPKKTTALACVIGLKLDLQQANDLLKRAGLTISHSNLTDVIVEYFIVHGNYDIDAINLALYERDLVPLGSRNE